MEIAGRRIGPSEPMYIIAELSANHGQDFDTAVMMIQVAAECGVDAVKLQTYTPDTITLRSSSAPFVIKPGSLWAGRTLHDLYLDAFTPWDWIPHLMEVAEKNQVQLFSSVFDLSSVDVLEAHDVSAYKVSSFELIDHGLLHRVGSTGKPVILSTGMATFTEIAEAVTVLSAAGCGDLGLLHCNSGYPASPEEMNLRTIPHLADTFACPVGLSDHTIDGEAAVVARSLGACMLEKHFVLDRSRGALDAQFSLEPHELAAMVAAVRRAEAMLGQVSYGPTAREETSIVHRRSLFVSEDVASGQRLTDSNVRSVRPADGLDPKYLDLVLTSVAKRHLKAGEPLDWSMIDVRGEPQL